MGLSLEALIKPALAGPEEVEIIDPVQVPELVAVVDVGSTKIGLGFFDLRTGRQLDLKPKERKDKHWLSYATQTYSLETDQGLLHWKIADGDQIYEHVSTQVSQISAKLGLTPEEISLFALTGLTNSLAVEYDDGRVIVLLDEPSLAAPLNNGQKKTVLGEHGLQSLKPTSSLMKLLTLERFPTVVRALFGPEAKFENLHFNTMLGLIAGAFQENGFSAIPLTDLYGFSTQREMSREETQTMLSELGFSSQQIAFMTELCFHPSTEETLYYVINDFRVEAEYLSELWQNGVLKSGDLAVSTDSVGKVVGPPNSNLFAKTIATTSIELPYFSQRMTGTVYTAWMRDKLTKGLWPEQAGQGNHFFDRVNEVIGEGIDEQDNPYLFDPDGTDPNEGPIGRLYKKTNSALTVISLEQALNFSPLQKKQIIRALARGIFFGLREKIDKSGARPSRIILYGGITLNGYWRETIAQCFGSNQEVLVMDMASGMAAAAVLVARLRGIESKSQPPQISSIQVGLKRENPLTDRTEEYRQWQQDKQGKAGF